MLVLRSVGCGGGGGGKKRRGKAYAPYILASSSHTDGHAHADDGCDGGVHCSRLLTPE